MNGIGSIDSGSFIEFKKKKKMMMNTSGNGDKMNRSDWWRPGSLSGKKEFLKDFYHCSHEAVLELLGLNCV